MNRIVFVILAVLLILSMFASGCGIRTEIELAPIEDIDIWCNNSSPREYVAYITSIESDGCHKFDSYNMTRVDSAVQVEIFNIVSIGGACHEAQTLVEHTIALGNDFVPGVNYTIEVNDVTVTFVVDGITVYPAPIRKVLIRSDELSPPEYFVDVEWGEPYVCDHLDSIDVTRTGNTTVIVEILNRRSCTGYPNEYSHNWEIISIGNDFVPGINYTVEVNDVIKTFIAEA